MYGVLLECTLRNLGASLKFSLLPTEVVIYIISKTSCGWLGESMKKIVVAGSLGAAVLASMPLTGVFLGGSITLEGLGALEKFLDPELFISLASMSLTAAALFYFLSDRQFASARQLHNNSFNEEEQEKKDAANIKSDRQKGKSRILEKAGIYFMLAFVVAVAGIFESFGLDQIFDAQFPETASCAQIGLAHGLSADVAGDRCETLLETIARYPIAAVEDVAGSLALVTFLLFCGLGAKDVLQTFGGEG